MFIYNVTVNIEAEIQQEWVKWMKEQHMPDVMKTGCFVDSQLIKVLYVEDQGHTYSAQYKFEKISDIENYQKNFAKALQEEHKQKFGEKYTAFRTLLEIV